MQTNANLFTRHDTLFGVCEGLGQDLGVPPNLLRLAFAGLLFFSPLAAIGVYAGLGVLVLATRLLFPSRAQAAHAEPVQMSPVDGDNAEVEYKLAA